MTKVSDITLMIVDDDQFLLDMYTLKFKHAGFKVVAASSGLQAYDILKSGEYKIDLGLIDIVMPELDGFQFLAKVREEKLASNTKFVFLSNLSQEPDLKKADQLGVKSFIVKANFTPSEVVEKVKLLLKLE